MKRVTKNRSSLLQKMKEKGGKGGNGDVLEGGN